MKIGSVELPSPFAVAPMAGMTDSAFRRLVKRHGGWGFLVFPNLMCPGVRGGCSLMREPAHAATVIGAMAKAVKIPVTVKMRAGWNDTERNAPVLARMVQDAGAAAIAVHGRTAAQSYSGSADWDLVTRIADDLTIPVFGSGDCVEPEHIVDRIRSGVDGVLVGRGVLRNPWILAQAADIAAGRPARP